MCVGNINAYAIDSGLGFRSEMATFAPLKLETNIAYLPVVIINTAKTNTINKTPCDSFAMFVLGLGKFAQNS